MRKYQNRQRLKVTFIRLVDPIRLLFDILTNAFSKRIPVLFCIVRQQRNFSNKREAYKDLSTLFFSIFNFTLFRIIIIYIFLRDKALGLPWIWKSNNKKLRKMTRTIQTDKQKKQRRRRLREKDISTSNLFNPKIKNIFQQITSSSNSNFIKNFLSRTKGRPSVIKKKREREKKFLPDIKNLHISIHPFSIFLKMHKFMYPVITTPPLPSYLFSNLRSLVRMYLAFHSGYSTKN